MPENSHHSHDHQSTSMDQDNPLHLQNSDSPGMKLVSEQFDGTGFSNWKRSMWLYSLYLGHLFVHLLTRLTRMCSSADGKIARIILMSSAYRYVAMVCKPSVVTHSCVARFAGLNLVIVKGQRLEIFKLTGDVLEPLIDVQIYGKVVLLESAFAPLTDGPQPCDTELLFMATRHNCFVLQWNPKRSELMTRSSVEIPVPSHARASQNSIAIFNRELGLIGLHQYNGSFEVICVIKEGRLGKAYSIGLLDNMVLDIKFLRGCQKPTIAVLYQNNYGDSYYLKTCEVGYSKDKKSFKGFWSINNLRDEPRVLIPVAAPICGVLIFGKRSIAYFAYGSASPFKITNTEHVITVKSYDAISDWRYLLVGEDVLYKLNIHHDRGSYTGLKLTVLGQTSVSVPSTISFLGPEHLYVGSSCGDSQLLKMEGQHVEAVESYVNVGPIQDFWVVGLERQGQTTIVTLSGYMNDSSLRIVRDGFEMKKLVSVEHEGITGIWTLQSQTHDVLNQFLVVSHTSGTQIFSMNAGGLWEEIKIKGLSSGVETLLCHNVVHDQFVQVTSNSVQLISLTSRDLSDMYSFPSDYLISVATANMTKVLLARGRNLVYLEIGDGKLNEIKQEKCDCVVTCLAMNLVVEDKVYSERAAVGMYDDKSVRILSLPDLDILAKAQLEGVAQSVLLCSFEGKVYLLCGMGDGQLVTFSLNLETGELTDRKNVSLGSGKVKLCTFSSKNTTYIFAASDKPAVIYSRNKELFYRNLDINEVNFVCPFNFADVPDSLVLADGDEFTISTIEYQMPQFSFIQLQDSTQCICYQDYSQSFALCSVSKEGRGSIHLLSDQNFKTISSYTFGNHEMGVCILSCSFSNDDKEYYCVGTIYREMDEEDQDEDANQNEDGLESMGKILVFLVEHGKLSLVAEKEIEDIVESLVAINGKLLASFHVEIQLYNWMQYKDGTCGLELLCHIDGLSHCKILATRGNLFVDCDESMDVNVRMYKPETGDIKTLAYHLGSNTTATDFLNDDDMYLLGDGCNLVTLENIREGAIDDMRSCHVVGSFHIGYLVNRFRHGALVMHPPDSNLGHIPTCLFGTTDGAIGMIATLPHGQYDILENLQINLRKYIKGVGGLCPEQWRLYKGTLGDEIKVVGGKSFLDGDLIELFLSLSLSEQKKVSKDISMPVQDLVKKIEELKRLRW